MRAFILTGPRQFTVAEVEPPAAAPGQVVVDVERAGVCGTDVEFFTGHMAYLHQGHATYPMRLGHEWCGAVSAVGDGVDPAWMGQRVTGDTMLGCGHCHRCRTGRQHVCEDRSEIGVRSGWPGALAEQLPVPVTALRALPDSVGPVAGAMVEPAGSALRAVQAAALEPGDTALVLGAGTIALLVAQFALAHGAVVHVLGLTEPSLDFARTLGVHGAWTAAQLPAIPFDAIIDCSTGAGLPAAALDLIEPGKRIVFVGLSATPSLIDTRTMVLKDVTAVGILSASPALDGVIGHYASGSVDPRPLVAGTVGLAQVGDVLAGARPAGAGPGPKIHVDPRL
jgi:threonine dehydrogenase-like Zn-dependent dehydrogenase